MHIRYAMGICSQLGFGSDGTAFGDGVVAEPLGFGLRSMLSETFSFHTTLNVGRMLVPLVRDREGRIDYDSHFGIRAGGSRTALVVAPGAAFGYSFTGSRYQRFVADVRLGVEVGRGAWIGGVYARPYAGMWRAVGPDRAVPVTGGLVEIVGLGRIGNAQRSSP